VDGAVRDKYWTAWTAHCALYGASSDPETTYPDTDKLLTFAVAVREGQYRCGAQVKVQSVEKALRHIAQKLVLDGHPDPRKASPAQQSLDLPISCLLKSFGDNNPPAEPKLAIPISTITAISEQYRWNPHLDAVADLITIAFFYLLRVGEYTSPATYRAKRTIPLQLCDIRLWHKSIVLQHSSGLTNLLTANSAMICIVHTKNGSKGVVVHHEAFGGPICPVAMLAQQVANISLGPLSGTLDTVYHRSTAISKVTDRDIGIAVQWGAIYDGLLLRGYTLNRISSHSRWCHGPEAQWSLG
jgi:hypothetical protein